MTAMRALVALAIAFCLAMGTESARDILPEPVFAPHSAHSMSGCQVCVWGTRFAEDILFDPDLVGLAAGKVATEVCAGLPSDKEAQCLEYVQIIVTVVISYASGTYHEVVPSVACQPMCAGGVPQNMLVRKEENLTGAMECAFCEYAVKELQDAMEDDEERDAVMDDARAACKKLPESMQDACVQYVDEKGPIIIALLETAEPESVCEMMNACEDNRASRPALPAALLELSTKLTSLTAPSVAPATRPQLLRGDQQCEFCKVAVMEIRDKLDEPAFQKALVEYAKRVCERLGKDFASQCTEMVDQYAPLVFSMIEDELKPEEFCEMIHLCDPRYTIPH